MNGDKEYGTPEDLWNACCGYFNWADENPILETQVVRDGGLKTEREVHRVRPLSLADLLAHIGVDREEFDRLGALEEYAYFVERAKSVIFVQTFEAAAVGLIDPEKVAWELEGAGVES